MAEGYVLPLPPSPIPGESLLGYLQRLAEANGCDRVHWIAERAGIDLQKAAVGGADLSSLAALCLVDVAVLERMRCPPIEDGFVSFLGHRLRRDFIRNATPKVCGPCLAESGHHRLVWDLAFAGICPKHRVTLIDACRKCGLRLRWNTPSATRCVCGADLTLQAGAPVAPGEAEAVGAILDRISAPVANGTEPAPSAGALYLAPGEFIELLMFLGRHEASLDDGAGRTGRTLDRDDLAVVLRRGFALCHGWPKRFHDLLDRCRRARGADPNVLSLKSQFGHLYRSVARLAPTGWGGVVREAFRDYVRANPDVPFVGASRLMAGLEREKGYVNLTEAAGILGLSPQGLWHLMRSPAGQSVRSVGRGAHRLLLREDVEALAWKLADVIDLKELGRRLGIRTKRTVRSLADAGVFAMREGAELGRRRAFAVVASDVEAFLERLDVAASRESPVGRPIAFRNAARCAAEHGLSLAAFLAMVKRGELEPIGFAAGGEGMARYLFDLDELKARLSALVEAETGTISVAAAAERLKMRASAVYDLIKAGLLDARKLRRGAPKGLRVATESVTRFEQEFIDAPGIARALGISYQGVKGVVSALSPAPQPVARVGCHRTAVYRRASINLDDARRHARGRSRREKPRAARARPKKDGGAPREIGQ